MTTRFPPSRLQAALRLELARQVIRESDRYGFPVTQQHLQAVREAERVYNQATLWHALTTR